MWNFFRINYELLPIKLHFFFFYGAMGGVVPFMPVYAKGLGINATAVGVIFTLIPFCVVVSKPFFGFLTDYFRNIKAIVFILVIVTSAAFISILFVPPIPENVAKEEASCPDNILHQTTSYKESCETDPSKRSEICQTLQPGYWNNKTATSQHVGHENESKELKSCAILEETIRSKCNCSKENPPTLRNSTAILITATDDYDSPASMYSTFQFWIFVLLAVVSGTGATTLYSLSDAACYEVLGDRPQLYGRQRLFATISWGLATLFAGFLNDVATASNKKLDYSPGFYLMISLVVMDALLLLKIRLTKANFSLNICKDVGKMFKSYETVIFAIAVYFSGTFSGLLWSYQFWFLEDLGATQTLLGLTIAVQCLVAEVPMFFFADWFIRTFGYFYCLVGTFSAFFLRFLLYFVLRNPWLVLPIEIVHGLTYALFYACMTGYASCNAPDGSETTMMGIFGGIYEGLGVATGSLLGGVGFDKLGGRNTFLVSSIVSLLCVPSIFISHYFAKREDCGEDADKASRRNGDCHEVPR